MYADPSQRCKNFKFPPPLVERIEACVERIRKRAGKGPAKVYSIKRK